MQKSTFLTILYENISQVLTGKISLQNETFIALCLYCLVGPRRTKKRKSQVQEAQWHGGRRVGRWVYAAHLHRHQRQEGNLGRGPRHVSHNSSLKSGLRESG